MQEHHDPSFLESWGFSRTEPQRGFPQARFPPFRGSRPPSCGSRQQSLAHRVGSVPVSSSANAAPILPGYRPSRDGATLRPDRVEFPQIACMLLTLRLTAARHVGKTKPRSEPQRSDPVCTRNGVACFFPKMFLMNRYSCHNPCADIGYVAEIVPLLKGIRPMKPSLTGGAA
jgi:hypothetical protein